MTESRKHLEHHQALFRELNDQIREGANLDVSIFVCECGSEDCTSTVALSLEEFKRIRSNSTWFVVKTRSCQSGDRPGHQRPRRLRRRREGSLSPREPGGPRLARDISERSQLPTHPAHD